MRPLSLIIFVSLFSSTTVRPMDETQKKALILGCLGGTCAYAGCKVIDWTINKFRKSDRSETTVAQTCSDLERKLELQTQQRVKDMSDMRNRLDGNQQRIEALEKTDEDICQSQIKLSDLMADSIRKQKENEDNISELFTMLEELTKSRKQQAMLLGEHDQVIRNNAGAFAENTINIARLASSVLKLSDAIIKKNDQITDEEAQDIQTLQKILLQYSVPSSGARTTELSTTSARKFTLTDQSDNDEIVLATIRKEFKKSASDTQCLRSPRLTNSAGSLYPAAEESRSGSIVISPVDSSGQNSPLSSPGSTTMKSEDGYNSANCDAFAEDPV